MPTTQLNAYYRAGQEAFKQKKFEITIEKMRAFIDGLRQDRSLSSANINLGHAYFTMGLCYDKLNKSIVALGALEQAKAVYSECEGENGHNYNRAQRRAATIALTTATSMTLGKDPLELANGEPTSAFNQHLLTVYYNPDAIQTTPHFPANVMATASEAPVYPLEGEEQTHRDIFCIAQQKALEATYIYVSEAVLQPARRHKKATAFGLTPKRLLQLIHKIAKLCASLIAISNVNGGYVNGYLEHTMTIRRETGLKDRDFDTTLLSPNNIDILKQCYPNDENVAEVFTDFCHKYDQAFLATMEEYDQVFSAEHDDYAECYQAWLNTAIEAIILKHGLNQHPGYRYYRRIYDLGSTSENIVPDMAQYANELHTQLVSEKNPYKIAEYAITGLSRILPFVKGNGKTGRILANTILLLHGLPAINFADIGQYYRLVEQSLEKPGPLAELILMRSMQAFGAKPQVLSRDCLVGEFQMMHNRVLCAKDSFTIESAPPLVVNAEYCYLKGAKLLKGSEPEQTTALFYIHLGIMLDQSTNRTVNKAHMYLASAKICLQRSNFTVAHQQATYAYQFFKHRAHPSTELADSAENLYLQLKSIGPLLNQSCEERQLQEKLAQYCTDDIDVALRRAAGKGDIEDLQFFAEYCPSLDVRDNDIFQRTALHWACVYQKNECANFLIENGADTSLLDASGKTARHYDTSCGGIRWSIFHESATRFLVC